MATYKGIGFDDTNGRIRTATSSDDVEFDAQISANDGVVVDAGGLTVTLGGVTVSAGGAAITGNSSVSGNLTVTGTLISEDEQQVLIQDNFLDLNFGKVGTAYEQTGLTFNYQANDTDVQAEGELEVTNNSNLVANTSTFTLTKADSSTAIFTAKSSGAVGQEFNIGADENATAQNIANAVDNHPDFSAFSQGAVVEITLGTGGASGNGKSISTNAPTAIGNISNFSGGLTRDILSVDTTSNTLTFTAGTTTARAKLAFDTTSVLPIGTFAEGDIIQINGTGSGENDGIYIVHSNSVAGELDVKSSTLTSPDTPNSAFALLNFTAESVTTANPVTIANVNLMALRASSAGALQSADGNTDGQFATYDSVGADTSLQEAYEAGSIITTNGNDIDFRLNNGNFEVQGGGLVDFGSTSSLSAFNLDTSGAIAIDSSGGTISLDAGAASNFTTSAGVLTLQGAGGITANSTGQTIDVNGGSLDVDTTGDITLNGSGAGNFIVADELDLQSSNGNVDIDAGDNVTIDAAGLFSIQGAENSDITVNGNDDASDVGLNLICGNGGTQEGNIGITSSLGGNITLQNGAGNFELIITTDTATFAANVLPGTDDAFDLGSSTSAWSEAHLETLLNFTGAATGESSIAIPNNQTDALSLTTTGGVADIFTVSTTTGSEEFSFVYQVSFSETNGFYFANESTSVNSFIDDDTFSSGVDANAIASAESIKAYVDNFGISNFARVVSLVADVNISKGQVVAIKVTGGNEGRAILADADDIDTCNVIGIALEGVTSGTSVRIAQAGSIGGLSGLTAGAKVYASLTGGALTSDISGFSAGDVVFQVGFAITTTSIVIQPMFVMELG